MTSIYPTILNKIKTILEGVSVIKEVHGYPASKLEKFPCAIYIPSGFDNEFADSGSNFKIYKFKIYIVIGIKQTTLDAVYNTVMPAALDAVLAAFDNGWSFDSIDGHRAWGRISTGEWALSDDQDGVTLSAEINLEVKLLTNN